MSRLLFPIAMALMVAAPAVAQGPVATIARGTYVCERPGHAGAAASQVLEEAGFVIETGSRYRAAQGSGTYLRRGDRMSFTSGPRNGEEYRILASGVLLRMRNGELDRTRCLRAGR